MLCKLSRISCISKKLLYQQRGKKREGWGGGMRARGREPQWPLSHKLPGTTQSPKAWHMHTALSVCPFRRQTSWDEPDKPACDSTRKRINRRECTISDTARQRQGKGRAALEYTLCYVGWHSLCSHFWSHLWMEQDDADPLEIKADHTVIGLTALMKIKSGISLSGMSPSRLQSWGRHSCEHANCR